MLKVLRDNIKYLSWILWLVILVFIAFVFVDFGTGLGAGPAGAGAAVSVGDESILAGSADRAACPSVAATIADGVTVASSTVSPVVFAIMVCPLMSAPGP